jgi:hypothetical protein
MIGPAFLAASLACFAISVVAIDGLILKVDVTGRIILGLLWATLSVVWLESCFGVFFGRD